MRVLMLPLTLIWLDAAKYGIFSHTQDFCRRDLKNEIAFDEPVSALRAARSTFSTMISDDALGQNLYNQRQVVGVNSSGEFPGLTHF